MNSLGIHLIIGLYVKSNGDKLLGTWVNGTLIGDSISIIIVTYKYSNGDTYTGGLLADKKHGKGILQFNNGDYYEGEMLNDLRDGVGM